MRSIVKPTTGPEYLLYRSLDLYQSYDKIVQQNTAPEKDVLSTLRYIRDLKLYQEEFGTFEEYCKARSNLSYRHIIFQIKVWEMKELLARWVPEGMLPQTDRQYEELVHDPKPQKAFQQAQEETGKDQPTAAEIRDVVHWRNATEGSIIADELARDSEPCEAYRKAQEFSGMDQPTAVDIKFIVNQRNRTDTSIISDELAKPIPKHLAENCKTAVNDAPLGSQLEKCRRVLEKLPQGVVANIIKMCIQENKDELEWAEFDIECLMCRGDVDLDSGCCRGTGCIPRPDEGKLPSEG